MENSKKPVRDWLLMLYLVTITKQSFSALSIQSILGYSRYETVWYMLQRIRKSMSIENQRLLSFYENSGFSLETKEHEVRKNNDVFLGSSRNISLIYSNIREPFGSVRKILIVSHPQEVLVDKVVGCEKMENRYRYRSVKTNQHLVYSQILEGFRNIAGTKKWIQNVFFNLKCKLEAIHHLVMPYYLQLYIDEFTFRFNFRKDPKIFNKSIELLFGISGQHCG